MYYSLFNIFYHFCFYDRGIVEASHLKPLDKNDKISSTGSFHQVWNSQAAKTTNDNQEIGVKLTDLKIKNIPKNSSEFWKEWKNIKTLQEKTSFLLKFTDDQLKQYFKLEIPSDQLEILIESLKNIEHVQKLSSILEAIKNSKRFNLAVSFMNSNLKENLKELIKKLENVNSDLTKNMLKLLS